MNMRYYLAASVAGLSIATAIATPAVAQETTSSVRGTVEADGAPVAGAQVVVEHVPSGTTSTSTTDANGNFKLVFVGVQEKASVQLIVKKEDLQVVIEPHPCELRTNGKPPFDDAWLAVRAKVAIEPPVQVGVSAWWTGE